MNVTRLAVVLSGGGAKSAAHVGALRALEETGFEPARFVATSMGAVVAACFAGGVSYDEVLKQIVRLTRHDVAVPSPGAMLGLFGKTVLQAAPLVETIGRLVRAERFDELRYPLTVTATDAETGELVLFGAGGRTDVGLREALYASCALPMYYPPAIIGERRYMDGGLRAVLPLGIAAREKPDLVYAVYVGPSLRETEGRNVSRLRVLSAHDNALRILMAAQAEAELKSWDERIPLLLVRPEVEPRATFAVENAAHFVEEGYRAGAEALRAWRDGA